MSSSQVETAQDASNGKLDINGLARRIIGKFETIPPQFHQKSQIYRIPQKIREGNEKAYEPNLVSIGPYHWGNKNLQNMELHKLRFLRQLLKRVEEREHIPMGVQMNRYLEAFKRLEDEARAFYAEVISLKKGDFLEMMLLDGCFILEFLGGWIKQERTDPLFQASWIIDGLLHDLLLFENQLPFCVLLKLYDLTSDQSLPQLFLYAATLPIHHFILPHDQEEAEQDSIITHINNHVTGKAPLDQSLLNEVKHLLELIYKFLFIEDTLLIRESRWISTQDYEELQDRMAEMKNKYSVTDLGNSGIVFKRVERKNFYDIVLKDKTLEIPAILVTGKTEVMLRNLIAYEGNGHLTDRKYISDYVVFMDNLIGSAKDVELLRHKGIVEHYLGDDEAVSTMFNKIGFETMASTEYYYVDIVAGLNKHSQRKWNEWKTTFRRNYLNSPWALISVIAAFILLLLTLLQTLYGALSYHASL